ncbi:hypothetical protein CTEN210_11975 [Chaetoceros tenuissimus]|uniref:CW-type domain-containing protein n=1 Tax=Chaetoceros tenuissimus TaxID=426638 RepID=A0AAD3D3P0_9STRA|nr:hypothetical protein CTEN210_11975 [Chaetoceros tenuissimus]
MGSWIVDNWITCVECGKWRMLPLTLSQKELDNLPEFWSCQMNHYDKQRSTCSAPEMSKTYMDQWFKKAEQLKIEQKAMNLDFVNDGGVILTTIDVTDAPEEGRPNKVTFSDTTKGRNDDDDAVSLHNIREVARTGEGWAT